MRAYLNAVRRDLAPPLRSRLRRTLDAALRPLTHRLAVAPAETTLHRWELAARSSPEVKVAQRALYHQYRDLIARGTPPALSETGFRCFSQFEEDGKLLFIFAALGIPSGEFVDIGAADGINSNCANLAINFAWRGVFFDADPVNIARGQAYYTAHRDTWVYPPKLFCKLIGTDNVNGLLRGAGVSASPDLLSIDIDGNDYWIWRAIDVCEPKVVIIETHIEFGLQSIVVPYERERHDGRGSASPVAMTELAHKKGYRLVGASDYGFNTIYVRRGLGEDVLPEVTVESTLTHPRNAERNWGAAGARPSPPFAGHGGSAAFQSGA